MISREQALIEQCLHGDPDAFGELIRPYQDRLFNMLYRLVGHAEEAAELQQESVLRAFRALSAYKGESSFYTWLYRIAVNVVCTNRRKLRHRTISIDAGPGENDVELPDTDTQNNPSHRLEAEEQHRAVEQALASLAEPYRMVVVLKDVEDLKYEQISEILDIPVGTVRSRLHRARTELRERLQPLFEKGLL